MIIPLLDVLRHKALVYPVIAVVRIIFNNICDGTDYPISLTNICNQNTRFPSFLNLFDNREFKIGNNTFSDVSESFLSDININSNQVFLFDILHYDWSSDSNQEKNIFSLTAMGELLMHEDFVYDAFLNDIIFFFDLKEEAQHLLIRKFLIPLVLGSDNFSFNYNQLKDICIDESFKIWGGLFTKPMLLNSFSQFFLSEFASFRIEFFDDYNDPELRYLSVGRFFRRFLKYTIRRLYFKQKSSFPAIFDDMQNSDSLHVVQKVLCDIPLRIMDLASPPSLDTHKQNDNILSPQLQSILKAIMKSFYNFFPSSNQRDSEVHLFLKQWVSDQGDYFQTKFDVHNYYSECMTNSMIVMRSRLKRSWKLSKVGKELDRMYRYHQFMVHSNSPTFTNFIPMFLTVHDINFTFTYLMTSQGAIILKKFLNFSEWKQLESEFDSLSSYFSNTLISPLPPVTKFYWNPRFLCSILRSRLVNAIHLLTGSSAWASYQLKTPPLIFPSSIVNEYHDEKSRLRIQNLLDDEELFTLEWANPIEKYTSSENYTASMYDNDKFTRLTYDTSLVLDPTILRFFVDEMKMTLNAVFQYEKDNVEWNGKKNIPSFLLSMKLIPVDFSKSSRSKLSRTADDIFTSSIEIPFQVKRGLYRSRNLFKNKQKCQAIEFLNYIPMELKNVHYAISEHLKWLSFIESHLDSIRKARTLMTRSIVVSHVRDFIYEYFICPSPDVNSMDDHHVCFRNVTVLANRFVNNYPELEWIVRPEMKFADDIKAFSEFLKNTNGAQSPHETHSSFYRIKDDYVPITNTTNDQKMKFFYHENSKLYDTLSKYWKSHPWDDTLENLSYLSWPSYSYPNKDGNAPETIHLSPRDLLSIIPAELIRLFFSKMSSKTLSTVISLLKPIINENVDSTDISRCRKAAIQLSSVFQVSPRTLDPNLRDKLKEKDSKIQKKINEDDTESDTLMDPYLVNNLLFEENNNDKKDRFFLIFNPFSSVGIQNFFALEDRLRSYSISIDRASHYTDLFEKLSRDFAKSVDDVLDGFAADEATCSLQVDNLKIVSKFISSFVAPVNYNNRAHVSLTPVALENLAKDPFYQITATDFEFMQSFDHVLESFENFANTSLKPLQSFPNELNCEIGDEIESKGCLNFNAVKILATDFHVFFDYANVIAPKIAVARNLNFQIKEYMLNSVKIILTGMNENSDDEDGNTLGEYLNNNIGSRFPYLVETLRFLERSIFHSSTSFFKFQTRMRELPSLLKFYCGTHYFFQSSASRSISVIDWTKSFDELNLFVPFIVEWNRLMFHAQQIFAKLTLTENTNYRLSNAENLLEFLTFASNILFVQFPSFLTDLNKIHCNYAISIAVTYSMEVFVGLIGNSKNIKNLKYLKIAELDHYQQSANQILDEVAKYLNMQSTRDSYELLKELELKSFQKTKKLWEDLIKFPLSWLSSDKFSSISNFFEVCRDIVQFFLNIAQEILTDLLKLRKLKQSQADALLVELRKLQMGKNTLDIPSMFDQEVTPPLNSIRDLFFTDTFGIDFKWALNLPSEPQMLNNRFPEQIVELNDELSEVFLSWQHPPQGKVYMLHRVIELVITKRSLLNATSLTISHWLNYFSLSSMNGFSNMDEHILTSLYTSCTDSFGIIFDIFALHYHAVITIVKNGSLFTTVDDFAPILTNMQSDETVQFEVTLDTFINRFIYNKDSRPIHSCDTSNSGQRCRPFREGLTEMTTDDADVIPPALCFLGGSLEVYIDGVLPFPDTPRNAFIHPDFESDIAWATDIWNRALGLLAGLSFVGILLIINQIQIMYSKQPQTLEIQAEQKDDDWDTNSI